MFLCCDLFVFVQMEERKRTVLHNLSDLFGSEALNPLDYCERNWNEESYCDGGPVSVCTPGTAIYTAAALRRPFDKYALIYLHLLWLYISVGISRQISWNIE